MSQDKKETHAQAHTQAPPAAPTTPAKEPWDTDEFKKEVAAAGFPGSPQTDASFLAALYRFKSGSPPKQEHK